MGEIVTHKRVDSREEDSRVVTGTDRGKKRLLDIRLDTTRPSQNNLFQSKKTSITTSATKIILPEDVNKIFLTHITAATTVWLGETSSVTADGATAYPLRPDVPLELDVKKGNDVELYAIVASGSVSVYAGGVTKG